MAAPDLVDLHHRACDAFESRLAVVGATDWSRPTPCAEWNVRELVNHVVVEDLWTPPILAGGTIEEVGDRFDGDQLGDDPHGASHGAVADAKAAVAERGALERTVHLSFGDTPAPEYVMQLVADHLVHGWDLAVAVGGSRQLDAEVIDAVATWFSDREEMYRSAGVIGPAVDPRPGADAQARLLARFGRSAP